MNLSEQLLNGVKGSWNELIVKNSHFKELLTALQNCIDSGITIAPSIDNVFKAFTYFEVTETKMVILGMDPYPNPEYAMGLAFSVPKGVTVPMSLKNIYKEMLSDGIHPFSSEAEVHGDLTEWAERGVLLLNTALTLDSTTGTGSHCKMWEPFIDELLREMSLTYGRSETPVTYVLMGAHAKSKSKCIGKSEQCTILMSAHPSPLSYRHFKGSHILLNALNSVRTIHSSFTFTLK